MKGSSIRPLACAAALAAAALWFAWRPGSMGLSLSPADGGGPWPGETQNDAETPMAALLPPLAPMRPPSPLPSWRRVDADPFYPGAPPLAAAPPLFPGARAEIELGEVYAGLSAHAGFVLDHGAHSPADIVFGRLAASCDCVDVSLSARRPEDGGPTHLNVAIHTGSLTGAHEFTVRVEMLEPVRALTTLVFRVAAIPASADLLCRPPVFAWPEADEPHADKPHAEAANASIARIFNLSASPVRVIRMEAAGSGFAVETPTPLVLAAGTSREIRLRQTGAEPPSGWVLFETDHPDFGAWRVEVAAQ